MSVALFPGSFDPFHLGHLKIVEWAAGEWDEVVVAVMGNPEKASGWFSNDERARLAGLATQHLANVRCLAYQGLTGALAKEQHADVIIRSNHKEAEAEKSLAVLNRFMSGGVPTEFAPHDPDTGGISATAVRDLLASGDVEAAAALVPEPIRGELATAGRAESDGRPDTLVSGTGPMTMGRRAEPLRVAAVQDAPVFLDRDATLDKALTLLEQAAGEGAQLVVFPETFLPGYPDWVWRTRPWDEHATALYGLLFDNAVVMGSSTTLILGEAAKRYGVYLSIGINEREPAGSTLYNTQLLYAPDGTLASTHRKLMPTGGERLVWGQGDGSGLKVVETPFGRIGTLTCWENYMPLARAALYAQGVDIYLAPTWDNSSVWPATMQHIAKEGRVFAVGVNHCLQASDLPDDMPGLAELYADPDDWLARGNTMVVGPDGDIVQGPLQEKAGIVTADIDVNEARHLRHQFDPSGHYARPDVLSLNVDMTTKRAATVTRDKPSPEMLERMAALAAARRGQPPAVAGDGQSSTS